jgi:transcription antitermination factor NusG
VESVWIAAGHTSKVRRESYLSGGCCVRVIRGPFQGIEGIFQEVKGSMREVLSPGYIEHSISVEVAPERVERVKR